MNNWNSVGIEQVIIYLRINKMNSVLSLDFILHFLHSRTIEYILLTL